MGGRLRTDGMSLMSRCRRRSGRWERGVAAVEMVVVLPLLVVLAFGVSEAAWGLAQQQAVRSVAREGARIAANHPGDTPGLVAQVCDVDDIIGTATFEASGQPQGYPPTLYGSPIPYDRGERGFFEVKVDYDPLTGFLPVFNGITITERVWFDAEMDPADLPSGQPDWWSSGGGGATC